MNVTAHIVEYLKNTYHPHAILLHGSRAVGKERPHSDWDIIMFFKETLPEKKAYREEIAKEDIEWKACIVPMKNDNIIDIVGTRLQFAKILWENDDTGTQLLNRAHEEYKKGPCLSEDDVRRYRQFIEHKLGGMKDDVDTPYMFLRHLDVFFHRAVNWYFEIVHNEYPKAFYLAIPDIEKRDPAYHKLLMELVGNASPTEKIGTGQYIISFLFTKHNP